LYAVPTSPPGNAAVVIVGATAVEFTLVIDTRFASVPAMLVALTQKSLVPAVVAVPVIVPFSARLKGDAESSRLHVIGVVPVAVNVALYATPTVAFGNDVDVVVIVGATGVTIVMENCLVSFPAALTAFTVKVNVPTSVGVPVIVPAPSRLKPAGNAPLSRLHVKGIFASAVNV
jgi:hypothetical protein